MGQSPESKIVKHRSDHVRPTKGQKAAGSFTQKLKLQSFHGHKHLLDKQKTVTHPKSKLDGLKHKSACMHGGAGSSLPLQVAPGFIILMNNTDAQH